MKIGITISIFLLVIITSNPQVKAEINSGQTEIQYTSPVPGSRFNSPGTNIIFRSSQGLNSDIEITGSESKQHSFRKVITDGGKTLIIIPDTDFAHGETVEVALRDRRAKTKTRFSFSISDFKGMPQYESSDGFEKLIEEMNGRPTDFIDLSKFVLAGQSYSPTDTFPQIYTSMTHEINKGYIFISNIVFNPTVPNIPYLLILNNYGQPLWYRRMPIRCFDFKVQNGNMFTYFLAGKKYYGMDLSFNVVDSFYCGNGYTTDLHELVLFPNRHALLMSYDPQVINMGLIVAGGDTAAVVTGLIIQEIDQNKNVVFQWRSWDHFQITDATRINLTSHTVDYVHGNSIEQDLDGHLIISCRNMDEITKINRQTGQIIWRLGGRNNQFNFVNDPIRFSYQHSARRLANGNLILFDNGNYHSPQFSRAVEYKLDEVNMTATMVWEYRNSPDCYGSAMGSVQRLANGNTLIGWGATNPTVTEVRPNGTKAFELTLPSGVFSYRAFRQMWDGAPVEIPASTAISQNYPNPFNSSTRIRYQTSGNGNVIIRLYNMLGQEVTTLVNEFKEAGVYYIDFESSNLSSGVYFYNLNAGEFLESKRMVVLK